MVRTAKPKEPKAKEKVAAAPKPKAPAVKKPKAKPEKPPEPTPEEKIARLQEENKRLKRRLQSATECYITGCLFCVHNDPDRKRRPTACDECRRLSENKLVRGLEDHWAYDDTLE